MYKLIVAALFCFQLQASSYGHEVKSGGIQKPAYLLIISIRSYPQQPSWPEVDSKKDIENIFYFINRFAPFNKPVFLKDSSATKKNIIHSLHSILAGCEAGDKVYLHFSGGGFQLKTDTVKQVFMPYDAPSVEDVTDAVMNNNTPDLSHTILDNELINLIQQIRKKIGEKGQCIFTMDASHFGPKDVKPQSIIGRGGFLKVSDKEAGLSPFIMLTSCLEKEESYFIGHTEPYLRSFSQAARNYVDKAEEKKISFSNLFKGIKDEMQKLSARQTPAIAGSVESYVLDGSLTRTVIADEADDMISSGSRLYILSIGISNYNGDRLAFANCDDDAVLFAQTMKSSWTGDSNLVTTKLLLNNAASKTQIVKAINEIIAGAKDDDVFAFFFAGFTNEPKNRDGSFQETWFFGSTGKPVSIESRTGFTSNEIVTLTELKKLFDYLKCDKQLLFTEAGPSENFRREFIRSMIKTNPVITEIRKRNRVIIVPSQFGLDDVTCDVPIKHAPGIYFFSELPGSGVNIFNLFNAEESVRKSVVFQYRNAQFKCKYPREYISFFFEKEFVEDLQYFFSKDVSLSGSRGAGENENDVKLPPPYSGNKYALVIGTDKFYSWRPLQNPVNDAMSVADTLSTLFGFNTKVLTNPSLREIYNSLYAYRNILQENDQFLIYLAGHGYFDSTIYRDGFIVASDSKELRADTFLTSYMPFNQLRNITDNYRAKQIIVLLDVCFSGAFDDNVEALSGNINYNLTGKLTERSVGKKLDMITRKYITAGSRVEEVPDDYNGQHSPFAYFLLEGLRRAAKEKKYLSSGMLFKFIQSYLEDTVPLQAGFGKDQERSGSEFIFITK